MPGSNYYSDLWIMVKNAKGKMLTAWKADLDGGYYCLLEKLPVNARVGQKAGKAKQKDIKIKQQDSATEKKDPDTQQNDTAAEKKENSDKEAAETRLEKLLESLKEETDADGKNKTSISDKAHDQILLMAAKGGKNAAVNCRILDFSNHKQVYEVFSAADSLGVAAKAEYKPDNLFTVESSLPETDGTERAVSFSGSAKNVLRLYSTDGKIAKPWLRPLITEVSSLTVLGGRLFTEQLST